MAAIVACSWPAATSSFGIRRLCHGPPASISALPLGQTFSFPEHFTLGLCRTDFSGRSLTTSGSIRRRFGLQVQVPCVRKNVVVMRAYPSRGGTGGGRGQAHSVPALQRALSAAAYLIPLLDGLRFGRFLFQSFPATQLFIQPLLPLLQIYQSTPFACFLAFLALYLGIIHNSSPVLTRFTRFNAMQALILDITMVLPQLVERIISPRGGVGLKALGIFYSGIFVCLFSCILFSISLCLIGRQPRIPFIAEAADAQVPP
eukprot:TRINITY_DN614_c0_g1_i1.p1 TRINITY_DN614_c0_g1~~TRINITY_DN614_c0_g1_i1.p1  ORF type:complete len:259 (+),score=23.58 TRINITY_DN614_c0_g1_i1:96-872(+)